jgi:2-oxo-3-hexenedioate decarboxylase
LLRSARNDDQIEIRHGITMTSTSPQRLDDISNELMAQLGTGRQIAPFTTRGPSFDLADAYAVAERVREMRLARGERAVGRKIGFTNRAVQAAFGVSAPIWNYMFAGSVHDLAASGSFALAGTVAPRIEPEIVLHLASAPLLGMSERELAGCVDWVAHGYEIVDSIFPDWSFRAADAVAGFGVHTALLIGDKQPVAGKQAQWIDKLAGFTIELRSNDGVEKSGGGANVLGSPLAALKFLIEEIARYPSCRPLEAGEIITTGTLTDEMPIKAGQSWSTTLSGIELGGIRVAFR